ncbi:MAG: fused MFS/spermidine synthase [Sporichthyaceae bacterium]|nr:fused MFS/spermidine synthase [Sporichthyaceae bacterium]
MPSALATALVLLTSAAVLVLEVLVTRLVAPYVGLTLETYTAAIGVALAGIAGGAAIGGRLADTVDPRRWLGPVTALGGVLLLTARPTVFALGPSLFGSSMGTVLLVGAAVGPAVLALSAVTPGVIKLRLRSLEHTGTTVGRLSATGTLGALAGTFLTGFVLLAALPTSRILLLIGLLLVLAGVLLAVTLPRQGKRPDTPGLVAGVVVAALSATWLLTSDGPCQRETRYYCAQVVHDREREGGRTLVLDGLRHSYVDLDDPVYLEFSYTQRIGDVLATLPEGPLDALHLGLGGATLPRHLAVVRPGSRSTILEVDPGVLALDRERLGLVTGPDLTVVIGDARTSVAEQPPKAYDVVVGDAFGGLAVPWHLTTSEMIAQVRRVLRPGGVYVLNVIDHPPAHFVRAETATLRAAFEDVLLLGTDAQAAGEEGGNYVLVASDALLPRVELSALAAGRGAPDTAHDTRSFAAGAPILTDDDAPVDQLLTPYDLR